MARKAPRDCKFDWQGGVILSALLRARGGTIAGDLRFSAAGRSYGKRPHDAPTLIASEAIATKQRSARLVRCGRRGSIVRESLMSWRIALVALVTCTPALAHDNGQYGNVPPEVRAWFKGVKSHAGTPCCDIADGHATDYDMRESKY